jgi:hypothetical protein
MEINLNFILRNLFCVLIMMIFSIQLFSQVQRLDSAEIRGVSLRLETFYSVSCSGFEKSFVREISTKKIFNVDTLATFCNLIRRSKRSNRTDDIDVRIKVYLYQERESPWILCMDKFGNIILNGHLIKKNDKLIKWVKGCLR